MIDASVQTSGDLVKAIRTRRKEVKLSIATLAACGRIGIRAQLSDDEKRTAARLIKSIRRNAEAVASRLADV